MYEQSLDRNVFMLLYGIRAYAPHGGSYHFAKESPFRVAGFLRTFHHVYMLFSQNMSIECNAELNYDTCT